MLRRDKGLNRMQRELAEAEKWHYEEITLRGLNLSQFPTAVFHSPLCDILLKLDFSNNTLEQLPTCIACVTNLKHLLLGNNRLGYLPSEIKHLKHLITLDVSRNQLQKIPLCLREIDKLEFLNFSGNLITEFIPTILELPLLKKLYVTKNPIKNVPRDIFVDGLPSLRKYFSIHPAPIPDTNFITNQLNALTIKASNQPSESENSCEFSISADSPFSRHFPTSDYGSYSFDVSSVANHSDSWFDDETCSCYGDHGSDSDPDFDTEFELSPRSDDDCSESDSETDSYVERILHDRRLLIKYRKISVIIPQHNKTNLRRNQFCLDVIEDLFYFPELTERSVHASQIVSVTPHGARFYETEPASIYIPIGVEVESESEIVCLCSESKQGEIPDWQPIPRTDFKLNNERNAVTIYTLHFSLFTVVVARNYPEASTNVSSEEESTITLEDVPGVCVKFPADAVFENIEAKVKCFYGDEPYGVDTNHEEPRALATPVISLEPHGCKFRPGKPVTVKLPLPDCQQIMDSFKFNPKNKLSIWYSSSDQEENLNWKRYDEDFEIERNSDGNYVVIFEVNHFSWWKGVWDILASTLQHCKVGVSYFYPYIRFSMMCQAMMEENKDTKSFGLEVICFRSDKTLPEMGNYKLRVGGSTKPKMVRPGAIEVRLVSNDFEADVLHGEDASLTKVEDDFRGMDFEKQFACVFKDSPVEKGVFGKVHVERVVETFKQPIFEFNLTKHADTAVEVFLSETTDRWSLLAVRELAGMLNITSDNNWKTFAKYLGFTNHEIKNKLNNTNDPFAFILGAYQARGGTPDEFVNALFKVGRQTKLGEIDPSAFANKFQQLGFRATDDEDSFSDGSAVAGPSGLQNLVDSGRRTPPRKRGSKSSDGTSSSKRRKRQISTDVEQSDLSSGEYSPVKLKSDIAPLSDMGLRENSEPVSDQSLWTIAPSVNSKWKAVGRTLGVPEEELVCIEHEHRDVTECTYQMFRKWKNMKPKKSNYGELYQALCSNNLNSVGQKYCSLPSASTSRLS